MREICTSGSTRGAWVASYRRPLSYSTGSLEAGRGWVGNPWYLTCVTHYLQVRHVKFARCLKMRENCRAPIMCAALTE